MKPIPPTDAPTGAVTVTVTDAVDDIVSGFYAAASGFSSWGDALQRFLQISSATAIHLDAIDLVQDRIVYSHVASSRSATADPVYVTTHEVRQDGNVMVVLEIHRHTLRRPLATDEVAICRRLIRHLSDALALETRASQLGLESLLGTELVDRLRTPIVLVDETRTISHANPAARAFLAADPALVAIRNRLHCRSAADDATFLSSLRQLLQGSGSPASGKRKVFVRTDAASGSPLGLYLYALRPEGTRRVFGERPLAMILLHRPGGRLDLDPFVVAAAFDLTPAEAKVAVCTAGGSTAAEISRLHNVSTNTIRSQLSSVFMKTGTARQAELVSALSSLPMFALGLAG